MEKETISIRIASPDDAAKLLAVYAPYVTDTVISFEYEVPSLEEFTERIKKTLKKYPYLVAEYQGEILGYAYTGPFVGRAAYAWGAETTIYLQKSRKKMGIGKKLYTVLEEISKLQRILNLNACIGSPVVEDEYLTKNSMQFHQHLGYRLVGEFQQCGYKFGRWYNMVWMEKIIGPHTSPQLPVIPFPALPKEEVQKILGRA